MPLCGGMRERDVDQTVQDLCDKMKDKAAIKVGLNGKFSEFKAIKVASQVVAGTNYFVKVHTGGDVYMHLRIFVPLPCHGTEPELHGVEHPKTKDCALTYFGPN